MIYDSIIIGHGPAGITASINLVRAHKAVLAIGKDYGSLTNHDIINNYYGFENPISGTDLIQKALIQAKNLGVELLTESVVDIFEENDIFIVKTTLNIYKSKTVLLAMGRQKLNLPIKNYQKYLSKGVVLCEICDGFLYKNKKIAIYGTKPFLSSVVEHMSNLTNDITIFTTNNDTNYQYEVINDKILSFDGDTKLRSLTTTKKTYDFDAVFIAYGAPSASTLAKRMGIIMTNDNFIEVSNTFETNIKGVFAAGDVIGGDKQIVKASYDGYQAFKAILKHIKNK